MQHGWVFFDADGTLFDFDAAQAAALERTWHDSGLQPVSDLMARYQRINLELWSRYERGLATQDQVRVGRFVHLLEELGNSTVAPEELADAFVANLSREGRLIEGAATLLDDLSRHRSLALVTNGIAEVQRGRIARSGVADHFRAVVISGEVGTAKPAAGFFDAAFRACGDPHRSEVIIVGDSLSSDIQGGHDYGIATCWFNPLDREPDDSKPVPDHTVRDYDELRRVLGSI